MMRILHVTGVYRPRVGGIELFVEDLVDRQHRAGHDVDVLTSTPGPRPRRKVETHAGAGIIRVRSSVMLPPGLAEAYKVIDEGNYDVVHVHLSVVSPFSSAIARYAALQGVPVVNTVHSMWNGREKWVRLTSALASWKKTPMHWTAVSKVAASDMHAVLGHDVRIDVVPNAVDVDWWHPRVPQIETGEVTFVSVMRMAGRKRPLELLDTLETARARIPAEIAVRAVLVGDGPLSKRLAAEVAKRGLGGWVTLAGRLSRAEIRELYRRADVYIAPAHQESFGIAALEARAAGLAVVAMRSGGVGEFIGDGLEGVLCHNDFEMTTALINLATDASLRRAMVKYNREVPPRQDWPNTLTEFGKSYVSAGAEGTIRSAPPAAESTARDEQNHPSTRRPH
jgi:glycosyltransferase involved in cell wall biosynthesis